MWSLGFITQPAGYLSKKKRLPFKWEHDSILWKCINILEAVIIERNVSKKKMEFLFVLTSKIHGGILHRHKFADIGL